MEITEIFHNKAKSSIQRIVLPETGDARILKAAEILHKDKIAEVILIGKQTELEELAAQNDASLSGIEIIDPETSDKLESYAEKLQERRAHKGMTAEQALEMLKTDYLFYGAMMVNMEDADGMVAGAQSTTAHTLRSLIYCVGTAEGCSIISSFFIMVMPDDNPVSKTLGEDGILLFADCAVNPDPDARQLSEIALSTAESFKAFIGKEAKVGLLSFSTKGSAQHQDAEKVAEAAALAREKSPELMLDGEMQLDAAVIESVSQKKAPDSPLAGKANVLVFPDLNSGNIGYKLVQRFAGASAIGPVIQGAAKPINDLSRGCSVQDVVDVTALTAIQAQNSK